MKKCSTCEELKDESEYYNNKKTPDGLQYFCKACSDARIAARRSTQEHKKWAKEYDRKYYEAHKESIKAQARQWHEDNPGRIAERNRRWREENHEKRIAQHQKRRASKISNGGGGVTGQQWLELLIGYGRCCLACGSTENITMDHVIPLARGGTHDISNIQPLCADCNFHKHTKVIDYRELEMQGVGV